MNETMYNPFSLVGKTILVTGASSGIGRAAAVECAKMGATLVLTARNEQRLRDTLSLLPAGPHSIIPAELGSEEAAKNLVAQIPADVKLDGVVHCAGVSGLFLSTFLKEETALETLSTNLLSPIFINKYIQKKRKLNAHASIVFISSVAAYHPNIGQTIYAASKNGVIAAMKTLAREMFAKGIRANAICPAMVETPMTAPETQGLSEEQLAEDKAKHFLGRYGRPEEVAQMIVYLLSDATRWVTGSIFPIDGGYTL